MSVTQTKHVILLTRSFLVCGRLGFRWGGSGCLCALCGWKLCEWNAPPTNFTKNSNSRSKFNQTRCTRDFQLMIEEDRGDCGFIAGLLYRYGGSEKFFLFRVLRCIRALALWPIKMNSLCCGAQRQTAHCVYLLKYTMCVVRRLDDDSMLLLLCTPKCVFVVRRFLCLNYNGRTVAKHNCSSTNLTDMAFWSARFASYTLWRYTKYKHMLYLLFLLTSP